MSELVELINNVGFPIVITLYFMFRMEKTLQANTEILKELKLIIYDRLDLSSTRGRK